MVAERQPSLIDKNRTSVASSCSFYFRPCHSLREGWDVSKVLNFHSKSKFESAPGQLVTNGIFLPLASQRNLEPEVFAWNMVYHDRCIFIIFCPRKRHVWFTPFFAPYFRGPPHSPPCFLFFECGAGGGEGGGRGGGARGEREGRGKRGDESWRGGRECYKQNAFSSFFNCAFLNFRSCPKLIWINENLSE